MATDNIDPTVRDRLAKIEMDIATLFNRKPPPSGSEVGGLSFPLTATFPGLLANGDYTCPWTYRGPTVDFQSVIVKRKVAGASAIVFNMNGSTFTLAAGAVSAEYAFAFSLSDGDSWAVTITTAGDGAFATLEAIPVTA